MATQRSNQTRQNSTSMSQTAPMHKDFITVDTEKLYRQAYEDIKKEAETNGYLSIDDSIIEIKDSYSFLCDIAKVMGTNTPSLIAAAKKLEPYEKIKESADYKEFLNLYNAFENSVFDDSINEIRLKGKRKNIASTIFMYHTFRENTEEQTLCLAYEEYLNIFGCSSPLAQELFTRWEYYAINNNLECAIEYLKLAKKCCENNANLLCSDKACFLNADLDEVKTAILFLSEKEALKNALTVNDIQIITEQLQNTNAVNFGQYTKNIISDCIFSITNKLNANIAQDFSPQLMLEFAKSLFSIGETDPFRIFVCIYQIWLIEADNHDFDNADVCGSLLREIAPYAKTTGGYKTSSSEIELANTGNLKLAAELIGYKASYSGLNETISILSKIDYSSECDYVQGLAHKLALSQYEIIRESSGSKKERIDYMREFCKFLNGKEEYADIYKKAIDFIRGRDEVREKKSRSSTPWNKPIKNKPERKKVKKSKPAVFKNNEQNKKEEEEHGPIFPVQMILGFVLMSFSFLDFGYLGESAQKELNNLLIAFLVVYAIFSLIYIIRVVYKKGAGPSGLMIFGESFLIIACLAVNMIIINLSGRADVPVSGVYVSMAVLFGNLIVKLFCRKL